MPLLCTSVFFPQMKKYHLTMLWNLWIFIRPYYGLNVFVSYVAILPLKVMPLVTGAFGRCLNHEGGAVTEKCGVWLLTAQNPVNRPGWWKGMFALFWILANWEGVERVTSLQRLTSHHWQSRGSSFYRSRKGHSTHRTQSALTVILKLVSSCLISITLVVLGTVNL